MSIVIEKVFGATKKDIQDKKFNIWIGISLGNKYFTRTNIAEYIRYALDNTREDILIVIPERLHAVNIEVRNRKTKLAAHRKAWSIGDEREAEIREIVGAFDDNDQARINIARWDDIKTKYSEYRLEIIEEEFEKKSEFYRAILDIVTENIKSDKRIFSEEEKERLAKYILLELPVFLNGANYGGPRSGKRYECILYPGIGLLDKLVFDIREGKEFPDLANKLYINKSVVVVAEAYVK